MWALAAQLGYWSLERYDHVPIVQQARPALAAQMSALRLTQWRANRFIIGENFSPAKVDTSCTGTKFYHLAALCSLLSLQADDFTTGPACGVRWWRRYTLPSG